MKLCPVVSGSGWVFLLGVCLLVGSSSLSFDGSSGWSWCFLHSRSFCFGVFVVEFFFLIIYLFYLSTSGTHDLFPYSYFLYLYNIYLPLKKNRHKQAQMSLTIWPTKFILVKFKLKMVLHVCVELWLEKLKQIQK
jgi:hypothetical protein